MSDILHYTAPPQESWREQAACVGQFATFFPRGRETETGEAKAAKTCRTCPVIEQCLTSALADEGSAPARARVGVRGGLTRLERARLAGVREEEEKEKAPDRTELDRLLRLGTMNDVEIAKQLQLEVKVVHRRRHFLELPTIRERQTPAAIYAAKARPLPDGHVDWESTDEYPKVYIQGKARPISRFAFELGHGREPEGLVHRTCGHEGCIAWEHLADRQIREQQKQAA